MGKNQQLPNGQILLIDNVVPLKLERIDMPSSPQVIGDQKELGELFDNLAPGSGSAKVLRSYRAVGAVADTRYHSGRVIPSDVQEDAIRRAKESGRQMLMFIDHPAPGVNVGIHEGPVGRVELTSAMTCQFHYDRNTKQTVLDRIDVLDIPEGRKFIELIDAGILMGLSQRAVGKQEVSKIQDADGQEHTVLLVTHISDIFGWDFLHLDSANAGRVTQLQPLSDKSIHALRSSLSVSPGDLGDKHKQEPQELDSMNKKKKQEQTGNSQVNDNSQPINDSAIPTIPTSPTRSLNDKEQQELGARLAQENIELEKQIVAVVDKIEETAKGFKQLNDDFKSSYTNIEAEETLYTRIYTAAGVARREVYKINNDGNLSTAEKNAELQKLLEQMTECFKEISEAYVMAHMKAPDGSNENASGDSVSDKSTGASGADGNQKGGSGNEAAPIQDKNTGDGNGNAGPTYVPPSSSPSQEEQNEQQIQDSLSASSTLRDSVSQLLKEQGAKKTLVDLKQYANEAIKRQQLDDKTGEAVFGLVEKMIHPGCTKEQIEDGIKQSIELVKAGQASERLAGMGLESKGVNQMSVQVLGDNHSFGGSHLEGAKLLVDSLEATGQFKLSHKEKAKVPPKLQEVMDRFDKLFATQLARESQHLLDMKKQMSPDKHLFDASTAADFDTPATLSRLILFETYAADIIREIADFGVMDNDRSSIPITRWKRSDGSQTFRPSVLQRRGLQVAELNPISSGKMVTEFFNIDAVGRKLAATLSLEFITRSKRRTDITGTAMALRNLTEDVQRSILMDLFFEWIRAAAMHGASSFTKTITTLGATTTYRVHGTTDANTTSIVPNDSRSPLVVKLGTSAANRTVVPEFGTSSTGGGPGNAFFYTVEHSTSKITLVDANGAPAQPSIAADALEVIGYKADKEKRFDLSLPGGKEQDQHMNSLLFAVSDQRASLSSGGISDVGYYDPTTLLASVMTSELMKQAKAYQADGRRNAYNADGMVMEGNYGFTAGLSHWGSKIFPDDFGVIGHRDGVVFRNYEPLNLRGPIEARNSSGQIIGGEEYYTYQEDAIATPLVEKFGLVTFYRS